MSAEASVYRLWWAVVVGVTAGCLSWAVANVPLYGGSPVALSIFGSLVAAAGFLTPRLLEGMQDWRRRAIDLATPLLLVVGSALLGLALPVSAIPIVWAAPLAFLAWFAARGIATDLLGIDRTSDGEVVASTVSRLGGHFLLGLILLFLLVGLGSGRLTSLAVGLYAVVGVGALGWLQYRVRRREWSRGGAQVRGRIGRRWLLSALVLLAVVALVAGLTPTGLVLAVASAVWHALGPTLAQPVIGVLGQTDTHYYRVTGGAYGGIHHYARGKLPKHIPHPHVVGSAASNWAELALWMLAIGVVAYFGQAYWRHRFRGVPWRDALLGPLLDAWTRLRFAFHWSLDVAAVHLPDRLAVLLPGSGNAVRGVSRRRFGRLSPRERIGLYYLGVLRRARRCGVPCALWKTPREYVPVLGPRLGDAEDNFAGLSDVFVEARYSLHELSDGQADQARADARRVRGALQEVQGPDPRPEPR